MNYFGEAEENLPPSWWQRSKRRKEIKDMDRTEGQDTTPGQDMRVIDARVPVDERYTGAMAAVMRDEIESAKDIVSRLSRRDRSILSFYLHELDSILDSANLRDSF